MDTDYEQAISKHAMDWRFYLRLAKARKWLLISCCLIGSAVGISFALALPKSYTAETTLVIERPKPGTITQGDDYRFDFANKEYFLTQFEILKSDDLAFSVYQEFALEESSDESEAWKNSIRELAETIKNRVVGEEIQLDAALVEQKRFAKFKESLEIIPLTNTQVAKIRFSNENRQTAANVTNALAREYIQHNSRFLKNDANSASSALLSRLVKARERRADSEQQLHEYRVREKLLELSGEQTLQEIDLTQMQERSLEAEQELATVSERNDQVNHIFENYTVDKIENSPLLTADPQLQEVLQRYWERRQAYDKALSDLTPQHPDRPIARAELEVAKKILIQHARRRLSAIQEHYQRAQARANDASADLVAAKQAVQQRNQKQSMLAQLKQQVESDREIHATLSTKAKNLMDARALIPELGRVVDRAEPPVTSSELGVFLLGTLGGFGGGFLAFGFIFLRNIFDDELRTPADITRKTHLDTLGCLPITRTRRGGFYKSFLAKNSESTNTAAIRNLSILFRLEALEKSAQMVAITAPEDSRSSVEVAIKLARALAESKRTLLIDGTFHGNSLSESLVFEQEASNSMEQPTVLDQSVRTRQDSDLHYLPLCRSQSTRHALLEKSFNQQISGMRNNYEWILVITDPFSLGPEAVLWSHIADSTVMVAEAGRTKGESIRMAYRALKHHHKRVLGVVLNNANPKLNRKYSAGFMDFPSDVTTRQA